MTIYFLDSSALVKRYINEIGSNLVLGLFEPTLNNEIFIAAITRISRSRSITFTDATLICNQFKSDLQQDYQIIEITEVIINSGMSLAINEGLIIENPNIYP
jgi:predicted nucleic acid-binding protein